MLLVMGRPPFDLSLYLVTDRPLAGGRDLAGIVGRALAGGVTCVQLREKEADSRTFFELALEVRRLTRAAGAVFIVNDRLDIALASDADGLHVGHQDLPAEVARRLIGPERILGVTAATPDEARAAVAQGADYLGCNAVFATPTKTDTGAPLGVSGLRALVASSTVPVVAIGGIKAANAAEVLASGVAGIAVVSAIVAADDPEGAARELRRIVDAHRQPTGAGYA
jgi:thiamine-phosphate pyrophosphorylase